jgi:hypothetical protein
MSRVQLKINTTISPQGDKFLKSVRQFCRRLVIIFPHSVHQLPQVRFASAADALVHQGVSTRTGMRIVLKLLITRNTIILREPSAGIPL